MNFYCLHSAKSTGHGDGGSLAWIMTGGITYEPDYLVHGPNQWQLLFSDGHLTIPRLFPWQRAPFELYSACEDRSGHLWVGTRRGHESLLRMSPDGGTYEQYTEATGLSNGEIGPLIEDDDGHLWVGSRRGGVNVLRPSAFRVLGAAQALAGDNVCSVSPARALILRPSHSAARESG